MPLEARCVVADDVLSEDLDDVGRFLGHGTEELAHDGFDEGRMVFQGVMVVQGNDFDHDACVFAAGFVGVLGHDARVAFDLVFLGNQERPYGIEAELLLVQREDPRHKVLG